MYAHHETSLDEHLSWWAQVKDSKTKKYFMYQQLEHPLGIVSFTEIDTITRSANWAFYAAPKAPPGTGSKMEFLALEYAFGELSLQELNCEVLSFNTPVLGLHNKFGFNIVEIIENGHRVDENNSDIHKLQLTAQTWTRVRPLMLKRVERR